MAPQVAIAPLVFLISRWPVLVTWAIGSVGCFATLLPGALSKGRDSFSDLLMLGGVSSFLGLGVSVMVVGPVWMLLRAFAARPVLELEPGERLLHELFANHFLWGESRGGKLLVTSRRLGFRPTRFNVQLDTWSVRLEEVESLAVEGDRFLVVQHRNAAKPEWIVTWKAQPLVDYLGALARRAEEHRASDKAIGGVPRAA